MMFTIGSDPEVFLKNAQDAYVSAIGKIGGTKQNPRPLPIGPGYAVQEDNVALEFNIPPASSLEEFNGNMDRIMTYLREYVGGMGMHFGTDSAVLFAPEQLTDPKALEFGCDPDFNAWKNGDINPRPRASDKTLRTTGGHVHVGYPFQGEEEIITFIKHMDLFSVPSVFMDKGEMRKQLYGKAGAYRLTSFGGVEYRSLSNFWIFEEKYRNWVYNMVDHALVAWQNKSIDIDTEKPMILSAINKNNKTSAQYLIDKYNLQVV